MPFEGMDKLKVALEKVGPELRARLGRALKEEAEIISGNSQEDTPVQFGTLKNSHEVSEPEDTGNNIKVVISVGGPAEEYAIAVHEHLSEHSPPSWRAAEDKGTGVTWHRGGGPKFLEKNVLAAADGLAERLAERAGI